LTTVQQFQSTRPARGATGTDYERPQGLRVSIHAPRAGRDWALREALTRFWRFQSTRPARGATPTWSSRSSAHTGFNPRAPRGARREPVDLDACDRLVSIHAPRAGRD